MATAFGRPVARSVIAFLLVISTIYALNVARSHNLWHHPARATIIVSLLILWLSAVVVWRQRWAPIRLYIAPAHDRAL
jgi:hypothetical protein